MTNINKIVDKTRRKKINIATTAKKLNLIKKIKVFKSS